VDELTEEETVDINSVIRQVMNVARGQVAGRAAVHFDECPLPPLRCRPRELAQVFLNLLMNGVEAAPGGEVRFATRARQGEVEVTVEDNGSGMDEAVRSHIFEPFFTTRAVGSGTGLGLTVCNDIVRSHGGHIEVESAPGAGSTFTILLPAAEGAK